MSTRDFEIEKKVLLSVVSSLDSLISTAKSEFTTFSAAEKTQENTIKQVQTFAIETIEKIAEDDKGKLEALANYTNALLSNLSKIRSNAIISQHLSRGKILGYNDMKEQLSTQIGDIDKKISAFLRIEKLHNEGKEKILDPRARPKGERPEKISDVRLFKELTQDNDE